MSSILTKVFTEKILPSTIVEFGSQSTGLMSGKLKMNFNDEFILRID
jgi:hypothetical protein